MSYFSSIFKNSGRYEDRGEIGIHLDDGIVLGHLQDAPETRDVGAAQSFLALTVQHVISSGCRLLNSSASRPVPSGELSSTIRMWKPPGCSRMRPTIRSSFQSHCTWDYDDRLHDEIRGMVQAPARW